LNALTADAEKNFQSKNIDAAADSLSKVVTLAPSRTAVAPLPWKQPLYDAIKQSVADGQAANDWRRVLRLCSALSIIEPENARWKNAEKLARTRLRLIARYGPGGDWREATVGVIPQQVQEAVVNTHLNYYRDVELPAILNAGLDAVGDFVVVDELWAAFPTLADAGKREAFRKRIDMAKQADVRDPARTRAFFDNLLSANRVTVNLPDEVILREFGDGISAALDPMSSIIWPQDVAEFARSGPRGAIGLQLQADEARGDIRVIGTAEGGPARAAGIMADDIVRDIDGRQITGLTLSQVLRLLVGDEGTRVALVVQHPDGTQHQYNLMRTPPRQTRTVIASMIDPTSRIAVLRITAFTKNTLAELDAALEQITGDHPVALIIDLRNNAGGLLSAVGDTADRFISDGTIYETRSFRANPIPNAAHVFTATANNDVVFPLTVLVNRTTASGGELLAGALRDRCGAVIVGERTAGVGTVQMLWPLADRSAYLKLTTSQFYLPAGQTIQRKPDATTGGIDPDIAISLTTAEARQLAAQAETPRPDSDLALRLAIFVQQLRRDDTAATPR
jgi:carboxyl-terminal processing protease